MAIDVAVERKGERERAGSGFRNRNRNRKAEVIAHYGILIISDRRDSSGASQAIVRAFLRSNLLVVLDRNVLVYARRGFLSTLV
jgi:hypothetical protein